MDRDTYSSGSRDIVSSKGTEQFMAILKLNLIGLIRIVNIYYWYENLFFN